MAMISFQLDSQLKQRIQQRVESLGINYSAYLRSLAVADLAAVGGNEAQVENLSEHLTVLLETAQSLKLRSLSDASPDTVMPEEWETLFQSLHYLSSTLGLEDAEVKADL